MRLPKGFGSVVKLSGKRRNPYMARPAIRSGAMPKAIGYYRTYPEAMEALIEYNRNPYNTDDITFEEVFNRMMDDKEKSKGVAENTVVSYNYALKRMSPLHKRVFREIKLAEIQDIMDVVGKSKAAVEMQVAVVKQMYNYAMKYEIVSKNQSQYLVARSGVEDEKGVPFTDEELSVLKNHLDDSRARMVIYLCYTGFRVSAYKNMKNCGDYLQGGVKTKCSKDRIVPIHEAIKDWTEEVLHIDPKTMRYYFSALMDSLGMKHTPHDCRHTFSYLCDKYDVNPFTKRLLMGHALGSDVSDTHYGHRSYEQLREAIDKLVF